MTTAAAGTDLPARAGMRLGRWGVQAILLGLALLFFVPGQASVPPTDRDEARFVQATRQMLESGDFVDIRFQQEARHKKPVGIYWLQAAAVSALGGPEEAPLWAYRLPSLLGAVAAAMLTGWIASNAFGPLVGLAAGALMASTLLLGVEARIAKTDAVLLATILLAQVGLARAWLERADPEPLPWNRAAPFWAAVGLSILVKGPIVLLVTGATAAALAVFGRGAGWLRRLRPWPGVLLAVAITMPWLVLITLKTGGAFFSEAVGHDMLGKVAAGQESKGFPPGYYTLLLPVTFWPATLLLPPMIAWAWSRRKEPAVQFCIAWIVPSWLVFEAVPTKLFHYVLPTYPAFAILAGAALLDGAVATYRRLALLGLGLWALVGLALAGGMGGLALAVEGQLDAFAALAAVNVLGVLAVAAWIFGRGRPGRALGLAALGALLVYALAFAHVLPGLSAVWVSPRLAAAVEENRPCPGSLLASAGYSEPSLVFLTGAHTVLTEGGGAANHLLADPACALAAVETRQRAAFDAALAAAGRVPQAVASVSGINYSKGQKVELTLFRLPGEPR
ncbi:ArnT family glycosyltransferase [Arenibaculum pallidiluteum]|uniref:ArnT family glycosyltransferase n=1 Tax=Arenibaculum pallidiluteum TaxID=2812559 RepID=UPI001F3C3BDE|nr:glycosyltransferase family 39 protein [Arenibaculum pallidiluteum]